MKPPVLIKGASRYEIDEAGIICDAVTKRISRVRKNKKYFTVGLYTDGGRRKIFSVHRLVAIAFLPNPDKLPFVVLKDRNPANYHVSNLEWCSAEGALAKAVASRPKGVHWKANTNTSLPQVPYTAYNMVETLSFHSLGAVARHFGKPYKSIASQVIRASKTEEATLYGYQWKKGTL